MYYMVHLNYVLVQLIEKKSKTSATNIKASLLVSVVNAPVS